MRPSLTLLTLYCTCPWIKSNPILISQNTVVVVVEEFLAPCILKKHINTRKYSVTNKGPAIRMILFSFNSSLWRKFWLHSVTAVEKKNYTVCVARNWFPINLTMLLGLPLGWIFPRKMWKGVELQHKRSVSAIVQPMPEEGLLFPWSSVKQLE